MALAAEKASDRARNYLLERQNPNAQKLWFEKMKSEKGESILRGAQKIAGGG